MNPHWQKWGVKLGCVLLLSGCAYVKEPGSANSGAKGGIPITSNAVGPLQLGMTPAQAEEALGLAYRITKPLDRPLIIIDAMHVVRDGTGAKVAEFFVQDTQAPNKPGNPIVTIVALSPKMKTAEGAAPGMTLEAASAIYGAPTLRKSAEEGFGGEWATFPGAPAGMRFSVRGPQGGPAGLYTPGTFQSMNYVTGAKIYAIEIGRSFLN